jgi:hypothetical protein
MARLGRAALVDHQRTSIMFRNQRTAFRRHSLAIAATLATALLAGACSSNGTVTQQTAACSSPGQFTVGPADDHCSCGDGGTTVVAVDPNICNETADGGDDGGAESCPWGSTMFSGQSTQAQGDDDDCKYHVVVTNTSPICQGSHGVTFQVVATRKTDGSALTGAAAGAEAFTTTPGDWDADSFCDDKSSHTSPTDNGAIVPFTENPAGTYTGTFVFDQSGAWTVRFHFFESCFDAPNSPHGHAAFHITVP